MPRGSRSSRTEPLPPNWETEIRPRIIARDNGICQWDIGGRICGQPGRNVDHKTPAHLGGTDDDANLWLLCDPHERRKSGAEGGKAWQARRLPRRRPKEMHPGIVS